MDADRLDLLARALATSGRRMLLWRLSGAALSLAIWTRDEDADLVAAKKCKKIKNKRKRKKCKKKAQRPTSPVLTYQCPSPGDGTANNFPTRDLPRSSRRRRAGRCIRSNST